MRGSLPDGNHLASTQEWKLMIEAIEMPTSLAGFTFLFADDEQHQRRFVEIRYGENQVAQVTAENYPTSFDVEWPSTGSRVRCTKIDFDKLMEALAFAQRMLALKLVGMAKTI
jgi:hypothetical protein